MPGYSERNHVETLGVIQHLETIKKHVWLLSYLGGCFKYVLLFFLCSSRSLGKIHQQSLEVGPTWWMWTGLLSGRPLAPFSMAQATRRPALAVKRVWDWGIHMESQHIIYVITSLLVGRGGNVGYSVFFFIFVADFSMYFVWLLLSCCPWVTEKQQSNEAVGWSFQRPCLVDSAEFHRHMHLSANAKKKKALTYTLERWPL